MLASQPPLPGYPAFCFLVKGLFLIFNQFSLAFSAIGGIAIFLIIVYTLKLVKVPILSLEGGLTSFLIFFNPLLWIMSNKYSPALIGAATALVAFYYLVSAHPNYNKRVALGWFFIGLLIGIYPIYIFFLVIPCLYSIFNGKKLALLLISILGGTSIWLFPLFLVEGWVNIYQTLQVQSIFKEVSPLSEFFLSNNLVQLFHSYWVDGLGGYWQDRSLLTVINSIGTILFLFFGTFILFNFDFSIRKISLLIGSLVLYTLLSLLFIKGNQNSEMALLIIPFFSIILSYGIIYFLINYNNLYTKAIIVVFLLIQFSLTIFLINQHKKPTAIAQVKKYFDENYKERVNVVAPSEINYYLEKQGVKAYFFTPDKFKNSLKAPTYKIVLVGTSNEIINKRPIKTMYFEHNPHVNHFCSKLILLEF